MLSPLCMTQTYGRARSWVREEGFSHPWSRAAICCVMHGGLSARGILMERSSPIILHFASFPVLIFRFHLRWAKGIPSWERGEICGFRGFYSKVDCWSSWCVRGLLVVYLRDRSTQVLRNKVILLVVWRVMNINLRLTKGTTLWFYIKIYSRLCCIFCIFDKWATFKLIIWFQRCAHSFPKVARRKHC